MNETLVAKQQSKPAQPAPAEPDDGDDVTTYKCYKRIARILRKIGAYEDKNQEDTLALFEWDFDNYLARLQAKDVEERRKKQAE